MAAPAQPSYPPPLRPAQRACYEALSLALQEGHVFAAVTGPANSGKTTVFDAVLTDRQSRSLRCIRITDPDKVPASLASQIEEVAYAEAGKPENLERHVVLAIDDAHTASDDLLRCLSRLAAMREPGRRVPQVLLVGRPELWHRLTTEDFAPLARRVAIRAVLPPLEDEVDPWASLEREVSQTMSQLRAESERSIAPIPFGAMYDREYESGYLTETKPGQLPLSNEPVPPPMEFALFPDPPPRSKRAASSESRRRLLLPLGCLAAAVGAFGLVLSFYDWPDLFGDMPWSGSHPAKTAPFVFSPATSSHGLPRPPGFGPAGPQRLAETAPAAATPAAPPPVPVASFAPPSNSPPAASLARAAQPDLPPAPRPSNMLRSVPASTDPGTAPAAAASALASPGPATPAATAPAMASPMVAPHVAPSPVAAPAAVTAQTAIPSVVAAPIAVPQPSAPPPAAAPTVARQTASLAAPAVQSAPTIVHPAPLPAPVITLLLRRGDEQSAIGDVYAARLLFERAAEAGSAQGAVRLARTYDVAFISASEAAALGDPAAAKRWYGRAVALGDKDAATRLKALNEGR